MELSESFCESIYEDMLYILHHKEAEESKLGTPLEPKMIFVRTSMDRWGYKNAYCKIVFMTQSGGHAVLSNGSKTVMISEEMELNDNNLILTNQVYIKEYFDQLEKCLTISKENLDPDYIYGFLQEVWHTPV